MSSGFDGRGSRGNYPHNTEKNVSPEEEEETHFLKAGHSNVEVEVWLTFCTGMAAKASVSYALTPKKRSHKLKLCLC